MQPRSTLPIGIAILACGLFAAGAYAAPVTTSLFYTTIAGPPDNVGVAVVTLSGSTLAIDSNTALASVNGAAGIVIAPDGNLLIGGQSQGFGGGASPAVLHEITRTGAFVGDGILPPGNGAYHLALGSTTPSGLFLRALCNAPTGGCGPSFTRFSMSNKPITGQTGISFGMVGPPGADLAGDGPGLRHRKPYMVLWRDPERQHHWTVRLQHLWRGRRRARPVSVPVPGLQRSLRSVLEHRHLRQW